MSDSVDRTGRLHGVCGLGSEVCAGVKGGASERMRGCAGTTTCASPAAPGPRPAVQAKGHHPKKMAPESEHADWREKQVHQWFFFEWTALDP